MGHLTETTLSLEQINAMDRARFTATFGGTFEHSPWVAEQAWEARPFDSAEGLHDAMVAAVHSAPEARQLALLNAHPELAGREARDQALTEASSDEQASAGLHALSADQMAAITENNQAYRAKFGFPFIIAVRGHTAESVIAEMARRIANDRETELETALAQVFRITSIRLDQMQIG